MKRFAHITDIHLKEEDPVNLGVNAENNWNRILDDVNKERITDMVFGGDIGDAAAHQWFFDSLKHFSCNIVLGNHDQYKNVIKYFDRNTASQHELYYINEDKFFRYIFLDTSAERMSAQQFAWLKHQLQTEKKIIIFIHHPVLPVDTPIDKAYPLENREDVKVSLLNSQRDITLFCGHYHLADEQRVENVRQIITPASSYQVIKTAPGVVEDGSAFGYRIVHLEENTIETKVKMFKNE